MTKQESFKVLYYQMGSVLVFFFKYLPWWQIGYSLYPRQENKPRQSCLRHLKRWWLCILLNKVIQWEKLLKKTLHLTIWSANGRNNVHLQHRVMNKYCNCFWVSYFSINQNLYVICVGIFCSTVVYALLSAFNLCGCLKTALMDDMLLCFQADQLKDAALHQDDSDLEKKRRETEALLQSMGITSEAPAGTFLYFPLNVHMNLFYIL